MAGVLCGKCGADVGEIGDEPVEQRKPCSNCGSTTRQVFLEATISAITLSATGSLTISTDVQAIADVANVLLQTVIIPGPKLNEGRLIQAVALPWFDIVGLLRRDPSIAFQMAPEKWEEMVAGAYQRAGFDEVILTPRSGDYGRDIIATMRGIGSIRVIDQVKAYKPDHLVTANDVRALLGVLTADGASKGFLTTTSSFAPRLPKDVLLTPYIGSRLELIDGKQLIARLSDLAKKPLDPMQRAVSLKRMSG